MAGLRRTRLGAKTAHRPGRTPARRPRDGRATRTLPKVKFQEDTQVIRDTCWTGATVVYSGHLGSPDGKRVTKGSAGTLSYEHLRPSEWKSFTGEGYRRCCTSTAWLGEALTVRLLRAERQWNQDAFLDDEDRWMYEDDAEHVRIIKETCSKDYSAPYNRQGQTWDPFVLKMWQMYRRTCPGPTDGWKPKK